MRKKGVYILILGMLSSLGGLLINLFGGFDKGLQTLLIMAGMDYLTGILCALVFKKSLKSSDGKFESVLSLKGLIRKGGIFVVVIIACRLDLLTGAGSTVRDSAILFFIVNEGLSIVENLGIMGVPMPKIIQKGFAALNREESQLMPPKSENKDEK